MSLLGNRMIVQSIAGKELTDGAITCNGYSGVLTTSSTAIASGASRTIVVSNRAVRSTAAVLMQAVYGGSDVAATDLVLTLTAVSNGSFTVKVANSHGSASAASPINIHFMVMP
mmetsp:Transcript_10623/g.26889  ORF Transcript_10623/g.26889 Transcript_10623/m.26889 type:complete len:114 (+) Transcript_10623:83-424(+)|eukprot:CAMPEP_0202054650 /NCGR_PEP_ID=MMETSP0963-20130614/9038_1 /ASSEMBLY_ACC=CAM_ASM_000494 /TAXON_ID=4773 /ORGANISM="Schizochytrium aggregatum, Strain ATCC28209" /LENGTH=113 /DNA_ID=CAMNT_0048620123 /DNA_START=68 /DNA_END=409 /DNA_ORIENTATION=-